MGGRVLRWGALAVLLIGAGVFLYSTGAELAERALEQSQKRVAELEEENLSLRQRAISQQSEVEAARLREQTLAERYRRDVPAGRLRELMEQLRAKLQSGIDPQRLQFLIAAAGHVQKCDQQPETKRFVVRTALSGGANDSVSFAGNALTVTARGQSATDAGGRPEAWFDAAMPISLTVAAIGGDTREVQGQLPLHAALVHDGSEYRFSALAGERGFVEVTVDRCDFP